MPSRLVRRKPLADRLKAYLNPLDLFDWISEELDSSGWDEWEKELADPIAHVLNIVFLIARANSGRTSTGRGDDIFREDPGYTGWLAWFVRLPKTRFVCEADAFAN